MVLTEKIVAWPTLYFFSYWELVASECTFSFCLPHGLLLFLLKLAFHFSWFPACYTFGNTPCVMLIKVGPAYMSSRTLMVFQIVLNIDTEPSSSLASSCQCCTQWTKWTFRCGCIASESGILFWSAGEANCELQNIIWFRKWL